MTTVRLKQRVAQLHRAGPVRQPTRIDLRFDVLTAAECERAARTRGRLDQRGLHGISDDDLDFSICLNERISGQREGPCVPNEFRHA
jgi:hypothetical protein